MMAVMMSMNLRQYLPPKVSWNEFYNDILSKGEARKVLIPRFSSSTAVVELQPGAIIKGRRVQTDRVFLTVDDVNHLEDRIREAERELGITPSEALDVLYTDNQFPRSLLVLQLVLTLLAFRFVMKRMAARTSPRSQGGAGTGDANDFFQSRFLGVSRLNYMRPDKDARPVTFKDVAGMHAPKQEVIELVTYLKHKDRYEKLGAKIPKGVLLTGPPGCGKTLLAKALATEAEVPFLALAGTDFVQMIGGLGAQRVRRLFADARKKAPCIVYIDELDSIGSRSSQASLSGGSQEKEQTLIQLLTELDGMVGREGIILLASTNIPEKLDTALLRPGRLDRKIQIDLPNHAERKEIFEMYLSRFSSLKGNPEDFSERLALITPGKSGAHIDNICNEATILAARNKLDFIDYSHLEQAVEKVMLGLARKTSSISAQERRVVAYHEAGHALTAWLQRHTPPLMKVSIASRVSSNLSASLLQPRQRYIRSYDEYFDDMCVLLGGRVAEVMHFNSLTQVSEDDLKNVRLTATDMILNKGMSPVLGPICFEYSRDSERGLKPYSKRTKAVVDQEISRLIREVHLRTEKLLCENKDTLEKLAEALLQNETLNYKDIELLIGAPPYAHLKEKPIYMTPTITPQPSPEV